MWGARVRRHGRARAAVVAAACASLLGAPAGAAATGTAADLGPAARLERDAVRGELEAASRELDELQAEVRRTAEAVAAVDDRLRTATTELRGTEDALADAAARAEATAAEERDAAAALAAASAELDTLRDAHRDGRDVLTARAVAAYKRGSDPATDLAFSGVVRADDWHQVAVTRGVLQRLLTEQQQAVADDADRTRTTARANADVGDLRRRAVATARDAAAEQAQVAALAGQQRRLVDDIDRERRTRADVLARLEGDAAARAVLVRDLEDRAAALERSAAAVLVPVVAVPEGGPPPAWAPGLPAAGRPWAAAIDAAAQREGLDGRLLAALVWAESAFRADVVSHAGAIGLVQLMPGTARGLGVDPWDPTANLAGGARYLRTQLDRFERVDLALAAYNAGPGRVRDGRIPAIVETQLYVVTVLDRYEQLVSATP